MRNEGIQSSVRKAVKAAGEYHHKIGTKAYKNLKCAKAALRKALRQGKFSTSTWQELLTYAEQVYGAPTPSESDQELTMSMHGVRITVQKVRGGIDIKIR